MTLSKSDYMQFLRHPALLWLKKYEKNRLPPTDEDTQAMFDAGHEFESYAEKLFPNAVKVGFDGYYEYNTLAYRTKEVMHNGAKVILQGGFETDEISCIVDVLENVEGNIFDLIEIKSNTKVKPEHEYDLAFQVEVLTRYGYQIRNISVIHANNEYVRNGEIEPEKLVSKTDITEKVKNLKDITCEQINKAKQILNSKTCPDLSPRYVNQLGISDHGTWIQDYLSVYEHLNPDLDKYCIYHLSYPSPDQIGKLEDMGIKTIKDIPEELALREKQKVQIQTTRDDKRVFDRDKIKEFIDSFIYPLYFFDYETFSHVIPFFDGQSPYKDYPFQYSLHVIRKLEGEVEHMEYLHNKNSNPMPELLKQLKNDIGDSGTVLTWNMSYEQGCNKRMAKIYPEYKEFLEQLNERIEDLMIPFSNIWFFDKNMMGSASVKKVLPVMCPELSYENMDVNNGLLARRMWTDTVIKGKNKDKRDEIMEDLSKYCTLDTFAMVRILEELRKIIEI